MNTNIILLGRDSFSTKVAYNFISQYYNIDCVILEKSVSQKQLLKRRVKKLGLWRVLGQILFQVMIVPVLKKFSQKRIREIVSQYKLNENSIPNDKIKNVSSVNTQETINILLAKSPQLIIINGTRIISKQVLDSLSVPFINMHAGITPKYRGVHGMYWALVNNDEKNAGVTIHFVDKGIDTGKIIHQAKISYTSIDNFVTYPFLQLATGLNLLKQAINEYLNNSINQFQNELGSQLWYHPTIWQYIKYRLRKGIK
jgi:methionyl-tRNA formyltransferase